MEHPTDSLAPVVDVDWLAGHPDAIVADVRWYLDGRDALAAYLGGHLPGAVFVDLERHLSGPVTETSGRHPLPTPDAFAASMGELGIGDDAVVVAYDDAGGAFAARLVWLLRLLGVSAAILDGGIDAWTGKLDTVDVRPRAASFTARPWPARAIATIENAVEGPVVVDARAAKRYGGDDAMDARAGHIPGALNAPFVGNLDQQGRFLPPQALADRFGALGIVDAADVIVYCGSGITACHDLIALEYAGLGRGRLYPGSWSQYALTERPVATGAEPGERPSPTTLPDGRRADL